MTASPGSARPPIDTSILVTTFRRPRHLALVLESIALQRSGPRDFEIIVSDDGSEDETARVVAAFAAAADVPVRFTTQPHDGFRLARVRNNAARLARGDYLMFIDGDCLLPRHHLAVHRRRRRPGVALLGFCGWLSEEASRLLVPENLAVTNLAGMLDPVERRRLARRHRRARWHAVTRHPTKPRLAGGDFGVWRSDFEAVNGFDERFVGWGQEDDDLGLRLRAAGVRLESVLDQTQSLHVWHPSDPSATPRWRDGANVSYFSRPGRLTACREGLVRRANASIAWGLPADVAATPLGRQLASLLATATIVAPAAACEIDIAVALAAVGFTRPAECRLLLVPAGTKPRARLAKEADRILTIDPADPGTLAAALAGVG
jgi:GT2 family glycosyltransferase